MEAEVTRIVFFVPDRVYSAHSFLGRTRRGESGHTVWDWGCVMRWMICPTNSSRKSKEKKRDWSSTFPAIRWIFSEDKKKYIDCRKSWAASIYFICYYFRFSRQPLFFPFARKNNHNINDSGSLLSYFVSHSSRYLFFFRYHRYPLPL